MTDETQTKTKGKAPSFIAYHVHDHKADESFWTRIGAAWSHEDGDGFSLQLYLTPLDGRITLRKPKAKA